MRPEKSFYTRWLLFERSLIKFNPCLCLEIRGHQGRDLTIPCYAPTYLNNPLLHWSFSHGEDPSPILTYDIQSGHSTSLPPWDNHVEVNGFQVPFGDGSLRLMDPRSSEHTGSYTCVFSVPHSTHTERTDVTIDSPGGEVTHTVRWPCAHTCDNLSDCEYGQ